MLWIQLGCFQTGAEQSLLQDKVQEHPGVAGWILEKEIFGVYFDPKRREKYALEGQQSLYADCG